MFGGLIGAIVGELGDLIVGGLVGAGLELGIGFATGNPVIKICVGFGTCIAGLFIAGITGKLIKICLGN